MPISVVTECPIHCDIRGLRAESAANLVVFERLDTPAAPELSQPSRIPSHLRPKCLRWPGSFLDMTFRFRRSALAQPAVALNCAALALAVLAAAPSVVQAFPITPAERSTAQQVASKGVPLSELTENAPDTYTVKRGDTLWHISGMFLKSPWRWPELWGMNLDQIHNPHLIYPGQLLVLEKIDGMARLKLGSTVGGVGDTIKLSPSIRSESSETSAIGAIPMNLIAPFLTDAMIFDANQLLSAPRIVAAQEGHLMMGRGNSAYVTGDLGNTRNWQIFRAPKALVDPDTKEVLG